MSVEEKQKYMSVEQTYRYQVLYDFGNVQHSLGKRAGILETVRYDEEEYY